MNWMIVVSVLRCIVVIICRFVFPFLTEWLNLFYFARCYE